MNCNIKYFDSRLVRYNTLDLLHKSVCSAKLKTKNLYKKVCKMSYAIMRFEKRKGGSIRAIEAHHERKKDKYKSNPDIRTEEIKNNYHLLKPKNSYYKEINNRISNAKCKVRSNSIKYIDTLITASPEIFNQISYREYFKNAYEFMCQKIKKDNIISAVIHLDERTPHMHLCFVPLTDDNRLSAKEILGNKAKLIKWQDEFYGYMNSIYPQLERGKSAAETKRKHIPVRLYKQSTVLSEQLKNIEKVLKDINMFNASKKRDEVIDMLKNWYPKASYFISEINLIKEGIEQSQKRNESLSSKLNSQDKSYKEKLKNIEESFNIEKENQNQKHIELIQEYNDLLKVYNELSNFISIIPEEIKRQVFIKYKRNKEQEDTIKEMER